MTLQNLGQYPYPSNRGYNVRGYARGASAIYHQRWTNPAASALNNYRTTIAGPNTTTITLTPNSSPALDGTLVTGTAGAKVARPDVGRNVVITVTHGSAVVALSGVISGRDQYGRLITEAWSVTAGGTSKTFTGKKSYTQVDQVTIVAVADASADSVTIGTGNVLGLDVNLAVGGTGAALKELSGGSLVTNGVYVAASTAATDDSIGTYAPNSAPNGATTYDVWYVSDNPEQS